MQMFVIFLFFVIVLTGEGHSWRMVKKNTTNVPRSTAQIYNDTPVPDNDPIIPNGGASRVPAPTNNPNPLPIGNNNRRNPYYGPDDCVSIPSPEMISEKKFSFIWQTETIKEYDLAEIVENKDIFQIQDSTTWSICPANEITDYYKRCLPKVVFLNTNVTSKSPSVIPKSYVSSGTGLNLILVQKTYPASIDHVVLVYNPDSLKRPIYLQLDPNKPYTHDIIYNKLRLLFHVRPAVFKNNTN